MAATTKARRKTTTEQGLGWRHMQGRAALMRKHQDDALCDWCGKPMYGDLTHTKNWDYDPEATNPACGKLQADHSTMPRSKALELGIPIPQPDRLLHGECNRQRGDGRNDHLAWINSGQPPVLDIQLSTTQLYMPWPKTVVA